MVCNITSDREGGHIEGVSWCMKRYRRNDITHYLDFKQGISPKNWFYADYPSF